MKNIVVWLWQFITYFIVGIPLRILYNVKPNIQFTCERDRSYIIAANHPKRIDPFLISYSFPLKDFVKLIPFRFITADIYMQNWRMRPFLLLYGCITTQTIGDKTVLTRAAELARKGETVFIFPSGKLEQLGEKVTPKVGVVRLERDVQNALVLPVQITYGSSWRKGTRITYKSAYRHQDFKQDLQPLANDIFRKVTGAI